jgi:hypothetical protein
MLSIAILAASDILYYLIPSKAVHSLLVASALVLYIVIFPRKSYKLSVFITIVIIIIFTLLTSMKSIELIDARYSAIIVACLTLLAVGQQYDFDKFKHQVNDLQKIIFVSCILSHIYFVLGGVEMLTFTAPDNREIYLYGTSLSNTPSYMFFLRPSFVFDEPGTLALFIFLCYTTVCIRDVHNSDFLFIANLLLTMSTTGLVLSIGLVTYRILKSRSLIYKLITILMISVTLGYSISKIRAELNPNEVGRLKLIFTQLSDLDTYTHTGTVLDQFTYFNPYYGNLWLILLFSITSFVYVKIHRQSNILLGLTIAGLFLLCNFARPKLLNYEFIMFSILILSSSHNKNVNRNRLTKRIIQNE